MHQDTSGRFDSAGYSLDGSAPRVSLSKAAQLADIRRLQRDDQTIRSRRAADSVDALGVGPYGLALNSAATFPRELEFLISPLLNLGDQQGMRFLLPALCGALVLAGIASANAQEWRSIIAHAPRAAGAAILWPARADHALDYGDGVSYRSRIDRGGHYSDWNRPYYYGYYGHRPAYYYSTYPCRTYFYRSAVNSDSDYCDW